MSDTYEKDEMNTFNSMLNMMICSSDNKDDQHTEKCLISDEPLEDNHITLLCHTNSIIYIFSTKLKIRSVNEIDLKFRN